MARLAEKIGANPENVKNVVNASNKAAKGETSDPFGRTVFGSPFTGCPIMLAGAGPWFTTPCPALESTSAVR
ncbi:MAG: hypothetical protein PHP02_05255 [Eubacteriales bacterium]|nr:hypothetical protein [Eubacteriales bacterium]